MSRLDSHPQRDTIRLQLSENRILKSIPATVLSELEPLLEIADHSKGDPLVRQDESAMDQIFILDGILKRVVSDANGNEIVLRFAAANDIDTTYAAWCLGTPVPYSIVAVNQVRVAKLSMHRWVDFLERHNELKARFQYEIMGVMAEVMAHTITLHLLDAPGRLARFKRKRPDLSGRIPMTQLASYLYIAPETLSRLKRRGGGA